MTGGNLRPRICRNPECGATFAGGPRAWYCPACRAVRQAETDRRYKARARRGETRPLGSQDICARCGETYTVTGGLQRYCPACAPLAVAEIDRAQGLAYYAANKDQINPVRNVRRRTLTATQAAILAGVSVAFVCRAIRSGRLRARKRPNDSRSWSIRAVDVLTWRAAVVAARKTDAG